MIKEVTLDFKTEGRLKGVVGIFLEQVVQENVESFLKEQNVIPLIKLTDHKITVVRQYKFGNIKYNLENNPTSFFSINVKVNTLSIDFIFTKVIEDYSKQDILKLKVPNMYKFEFDVLEFLETFKEKFVDGR